MSNKRSKYVTLSLNGEYKIAQLLLCKREMMQLPELEHLYSELLHEYQFLSSLLALETFGTRKILLFVRLCTLYSFEKEIEYTSTLSNGKASCRSTLKCQLNFALPRVRSKYVTTF